MGSRNVMKRPGAGLGRVRLRPNRGFTAVSPRDLIPGTDTSALGSRISRHRPTCAGIAGSKFGGFVGSTISMAGVGSATAPMREPFLN
jgi:hypothetical protein